jgi:hypothetical protein
MYVLTVYIPTPYLEQVKEAIFAAGGGRYAHYDRCSWQTLGDGQFRPLEGSHPFIGSFGKEEHVPEYRVEMICEDGRIAAVAAALRAAHPYEEPAFRFTRMADV